MNEHEATTNAFARMPRGIDERAQLLDRLRLLGAQAAPVEQAQQGEPAVLFRLGAQERYAIAYRHAEEIVQRAVLAQVPCTPSHVAGVMNLRGELVTVLDLKQLFRAQPAVYDAQAPILVLASGAVTVGVRVDEVLGQIGIDPARLEPPLPSDGVRNLAWVAGIHDGTVTVLDVAALLASSDLVVDERVG
jgi:purine-binding chemotaxis protein CheW